MSLKLWWHFHVTCAMLSLNSHYQSCQALHLVRAKSVDPAWFLEEKLMKSSKEVFILANSCLEGSKWYLSDQFWAFGVSLALFILQCLRLTCIFGGRDTRSNIPSGIRDKKKALELYARSKSIMQRGGLNLRKWKTNSYIVQEAINRSEVHLKLTIVQRNKKTCHQRRWSYNKTTNGISLNSDKNRSGKHRQRQIPNVCLWRHGRNQLCAGTLTPDQRSTPSRYLKRQPFWSC